MESLNKPSVRGNPSQNNKSGVQRQKIIESTTESLDSEVEKVMANWPSFLVMSFSDEDNSLKKINPFVVKKGLESFIGQVKSCKKLVNGNLLIEVSKKVH